MSQPPSSGRYVGSHAARDKSTRQQRTVGVLPPLDAQMGPNAGAGGLLPRLLHSSPNPSQPSQPHLPPPHPHATFDDSEDDSSDSEDEDSGTAVGRPAPSGAGSTPSKSSPRLPFTFDPQHLAFSSSSSSSSLVAAAAAAAAAASAGAGNPNSALPGFSLESAQGDSMAPSMLAPPTALDVIPFALPYLSIKDASSLRLVSKACGAAAATHSPEHLGIVKTPLHGPGHATLKVFETYGKGLLSLSLHRVPFADREALPSILRLTPNLRKLSLHDCGADWNYDDTAVGEAVAKLVHLQELRLQCGEQVSAERNPFQVIIRRCLGRAGTLQNLRKLTVFSRLDADTVAALVTYLNDHSNCRRLIKVKLSTGLLASPGATPALFQSITSSESLQKITLVRTDNNSSEPLRKGQCALLGQAIYHNRGIRALHLRRCGVWTDCLGALVPPGPTPNLLRLKLDGNSLGYCSGGLFNESMDLLLSRLPNLEALHLGNNTIDSNQAIGLAASIQRHRMLRLENLTLGSNDIGDNGCTAILKALPAGLRQLYLHGVDCTDATMPVLRECLDRWPQLWGLGLNGNPITDAGARVLAKALKNRLSLRDVGITLSDVTDQGIGRLATALATCRNLRYVYLYTTGFKSSQKVTAEAKEALKKALPPYACAAFDHRLSRYLKKP